MKSFSIENQAQLITVAKAIKTLCNTHSIFIIDGEMGAGKTTLVREIGKQLQVQDEVSSPTYGIVNTYFSEKYGEINHFDFYRIKDEEEAINSGLDEQLNSGNICFIEWAERISKLLPENCVRVHIDIVDTNRRKITIKL